MSTSVTNPMVDLYRRLADVGLNATFLRKMILPEGWDDQLAENPADYAEALAHLSRHLGLDPEALRDPARPVAFRDSGVRKLKKPPAATEDDLAAACALATGLAQLATTAATRPATPPPSDAAQIRREIFGRGAPWINLDNLADYCWSLGIPVLHLTSFPDATRPDGLAVRVGGRPAIVLCKKTAYAAWLLLILAHELGHIALGHVEDDGVLVDENLKHNIQDEEEAAANAFAAELLTGSPRRDVFQVGGRWPGGSQFAEWARDTGRRNRIDPGYLVLAYANVLEDRFWRVANAALDLIERRRGTMTLLREKLSEHLDWSSLPEDGSSFLRRVSRTGRNPHG